MRTLFKNELWCIEQLPVVCPARFRSTGRSLLDRIDEIADEQWKDQLLVSEQDVSGLVDITPGDL